MWMSQTRPPVQVSFMMVVLVVLIIWPSIIHTITYSNESELYYDDDDDDPKVLSARSRSDSPSSSSLIKIEVVIILVDSSNTSLGYSKALSRALKSIPMPVIPPSPPSSIQPPLQPSLSESIAHGVGSPKRIVWRVKNFVLSNYSSNSDENVRLTTATTTTTPPRTRNNFDDDEDESTSASGGVPAESERDEKNDRKRKNHLHHEPQLPQRNNNNNHALFHPNLIPQLCNFLGRTKAVALVNLIEDAGSERLLSLIANSASIPLIGSFHSTKPLQTEQKSEDDLHMSLATSVRQYARALGHLLINCHWHSFFVIFDETFSSQMIWKTQLSGMRIATSSPSTNNNNNHHQHLHVLSSRSSRNNNNHNNHRQNHGSEVFYNEQDYYDSVENFDYEPNNNDNDNNNNQRPNSADTADTVIDHDKEDDGEDEDEFPTLQPKFYSLSSKRLNNNNSNATFRVLNEITKSTQGVVILLCSETSLAQVFRVAQQLRMLNGDYIFILMDQYSEFEVIPDWIPNGVLSLRSPPKAQVGKQSLKRVGKLLASSLLSSLRNLSHEIAENDDQPSSSASSNKNSPNFNSFMTSSGGDGLSSQEEDANNNNNNAQVFTPSKVKEQLQQQQHQKWSAKKSFNNNNIKSSLTTPTASSTTINKLIFELLQNLPNVSCWMSSFTRKIFSEALTREMRAQIESQQLSNTNERSSSDGLNPHDQDSQLLSTQQYFEIHNLVGPKWNRMWKLVGNVSTETNEVHLDTIRWPGGEIFPIQEKQLRSYRIATILSPPFVMVIDSPDNKTCENGSPCLKVNTNSQEELTLIFADFTSEKRTRSDYEVACCDGLAIDLLHSVSRELNFKINLYLVPDGFFGSISSSGDWNGLMSAILSGSAHMSFAPFSVTSIRSTAIDFSTPFFFSGVGFLGIAKTQDVPLMAFLAPFSFELWAAIFITLNITAVAVALFEWLSPFGLNPWGRQRTKNFTMASALWVVWGRLFSHLVAFKAPKSWPNKFLINVWGGFSVIFVASYTANIAALFAGMFFERGVDVHDRSLLSQRVAAVKHSATHFYIKRENQHLWEHIQRFPVYSFQQGIDMLKNGSLDLLTGDGPLLDYYRGADPYCSLVDVSDHDKIGDDTYAVGMAKGFSMKESISALIAKYLRNGYMDHLQGKWYDQLGCFRRRRSEIYGARALGVDAVAGMIIMIALGMLVGLVILCLELVVYKYALPFLRRQPKGTVWRSPNIMFFSQKLYRFINCVELVSPHHAAKELVNTLRHGQITSLFQKSVKRKEHEQRRRRKSKAQFFEMIQEVRRVQKQEKQDKQEKQERQKRIQHSKHFTEADTEALRLQSSKMPKLIRVLGVEADVSNRIFETSTSSTGEPFQGPVLVIEEPIVEPIRRRSDIMETSFGGGESHGVTLRNILKKGGSGGPSTSDSLPMLHKCVDFDLKDEEDDDETFEIEQETEGISSAFSHANLRCLSKSEVINLWKSSDRQLREQLTEALKEKEALAMKLQCMDSGRPP